MRCKLSIFTLLWGLGTPHMIFASEGDRYPGPPDDKQLGGGVIVSGSSQPNKIDKAPPVEPSITNTSYSQRSSMTGGVRPISAVTVEPVAPAPRLMPSTGNYTVPASVAMTKPMATPAQISSYPVIPVLPEMAYSSVTHPCDAATCSPTFWKHRGKHCLSCEPDLFSKFSAWLKFSRPCIDTPCQTAPHRPPHWAWIDCNNRFRWGSAPSNGMGTCASGVCGTVPSSVVPRANEYQGTGKMPGLPMSVPTPSTNIPYGVSPAPVAPPAVTRLPQIDPLSSFKAPAESTETNILSEGYKRPPGVPISRPYR